MDWFLPSVLVGIAAFLAFPLLNRSLWLDELHTAWCIQSYSLPEIAQRSQAGNQTPLYFWGLSALARTVGGFSPSYGLPGRSALDQIGWPEALLRLPSLVAWIAAILLVKKLLRSDSENDYHPSVLGLILLWIILDQSQLFYATEARPYALVQLMSLAGWFVVARLWQSEGNAKRLQFLMVVWSVIAAITLYLHLTSAIPVGLQWLTIATWLFTGWRSTQVGTIKPLLLTWCTVTLGLSLVCCPLFNVASPVWQRRDLWSSFASLRSWSQALWMFPILPVLVPILAARFLEPLVGPSQQSSTSQSRTNRVLVLWWVAAFAPWIIAWLVTASGLAPIFHRRFIISAAIPIVILGGLELQKLRSTRWQQVVACVVLLSLIVSQGYRGLAPKNLVLLRKEDWRSACGWLSERASHSDQLWCSAGLIEQRWASWPLTTEQNNYLSFPLLSIYKVTTRENKLLEPNAIVDQQDIVSQLLAIRARQPRPDTHSISNKTSSIGDKHWIVWRGTSKSLENRLAKSIRSNSNNYRIATEIHQFGDVAVAEVNISAASQE